MWTQFNGDANKEVKTVQQACWFASSMRTRTAVSPAGLFSWAADFAGSQLPITFKPQLSDVAPPSVTEVPARGTKPSPRLSSADMGLLAPPHWSFARTLNRHETELLLKEGTSTHLWLSQCVPSLVPEPEGAVLAPAFVNSLCSWNCSSRKKATSSCSITNLIFIESHNPIPKHWNVLLKF